MGRFKYCLVFSLVFLVFLHGFSCFLHGCSCFCIVLLVFYMVFLFFIWFFLFFIWFLLFFTWFFLFFYMVFLEISTNIGGGAPPVVQPPISLPQRTSVLRENGEATCVSQGQVPTLAP